MNDVLYVSDTYILSKYMFVQIYTYVYSFIAYLTANISFFNSMQLDSRKPKVRLNSIYAEKNKMEVKRK